MRRLSWVSAAVIAVVLSACADGSGPNAGRTGIRFIGAPNTTDTVTATPAAPLVVEVRDGRGMPAPPGTVVHFTGARSPATIDPVPEMRVWDPAFSAYAGFATRETDAAGRVSVLVGFGTIAGPARLEVTVPTLGIEDTARFTVRPGQAARVILTPADTAVYTGRSFALRSSVVDRFGNLRSDPVAYSSSAGGLTVGSTGVVEASAIGRYAVTATTGSISASSGVSVVPQGTIAVVRYSAGAAWIATVGLDGSEPRNLARITQGGGIRPQPQWIPGSNRIIYTDINDALDPVLRTVDLEGRVTTFLSNPPATMTEQMEPSPAAAAPVVYFSAIDTRFHPYLYYLHRSTIDGGAPELLEVPIDGDLRTTRPSASPDGSRVAFVTIGIFIKVFDYATKTVSSWSVQGDHPSWSPDGSRIAYEFGQGPVRVMNADGTNQRAVTPSGRSYFGSISWSTDSKWLLARTIAETWELIEVETGKVLPLVHANGYPDASLR